MIRMNKTTDHILAVLREQFSAVMDGGKFAYAFDSSGSDGVDRAESEPEGWEITREKDGTRKTIDLSWRKMFIEAEVPAEITQALNRTTNIDAQGTQITSANDQDRAVPIWVLPVLESPATDDRFMRECSATSVSGTDIDYNIVVIVANPDRRVDDRLENCIFAVIEQTLLDNPSLMHPDTTFGHAAQGLEYVGFTLNQNPENALIPLGFAYQTWHVSPLPNVVQIMPMVAT